MRGAATTLPAPRFGLFAICGQLSSWLWLSGSYCFTTQDNGLIWFLKKEIARSLIFHLVFRRSISAHIPVIMADFALDIFRNVPHPPAETLAFVGASVSSTLRAFIHLNKPFVLVL